jgi:hypothetical protein
MIQERAMLAAVHISIWTAVKHDRGVSRDVAERNGAPMSAGRYNKQLLRGADKLDELRTLAGQVRQYFYKITLPWTDEGYRLLPANLYFDLTARMREFEAQFEQGVEAFLADLSAVHRAGAARVEWALPRGGLPEGREAAPQVRRQARSPAHSHRQRLSRADVGRGAGARRPRDRLECSAVAGARDGGSLEPAARCGLAHGGPAE